MYLRLHVAIALAIGANSFGMAWFMSHRFMPTQPEPYIVMPGKADSSAKNENSVAGRDHGHHGIGAGSKSKQKVLVLPLNLDTDEFKHIFIEGISRSTRLELSLDMCDKNSHWFVDINRCTLRELKRAMRKRSNALGKNRNQSITFADWSDVGLEESWLAELISLASNHFGSGNVHYMTRQHVDDRNIGDIKYDKEFSNYGDKWSWNGTEFGLGGRIMAARYSVRSDLVNSISKATGVEADGSSSSSSAIVMLPRPKDVVSFWNQEDVEDPLSEAKSELRASVSKLVASLGRSMNHLNVTTGISGEREGVGRNNVHDAYVRDLLTHKIVVVAQRDNWEGHYRLMEALSGGSLVMTDPMHPLPYLLEDGVNVIVYSSLKQLKEKILYYVSNENERLEIAIRGHRVAMNHHRSWHVMERILLGNWTTEHF